MRTRERAIRVLSSFLPHRLWSLVRRAPIDYSSGVERARSGARIPRPDSAKEVPNVASEPPIVIGLNAVIVAVTKESPRILTISADRDAASAADANLDILPHGPLDPHADRTLELSLRGWVRERTGIELGYVEQLYTFGDRDRTAGASGVAPRMISVAYLALVREGRVSGSARARWRDWYAFFPWEDSREGQPAVVREIIEPALDAWVARASDRTRRQERLERAGIAFGLAGSEWDGDRVLERYELLYEIGLVSESRRKRTHREGEPPPPELGRPMGMDHRRILATGMGRIRGKLPYRPVVFELLPGAFTLTRLQRVVEALAGVRLHKQNFRRLVERSGLVEGTGRMDSRTGGRPAELFRFRREVLRERRAPGVGLPATR
jgi:hypothetical protein